MYTCVHTHSRYRRRARERERCCVTSEAQFMQNSCIYHTYFIHIPYISHMKSNAKTQPKKHQNKVKHNQKYLPNPPKMGSKFFPGTLLGALLQKVLFLHLIFVPMVAKWEPRGSSKIIYNHKDSKKECPKKTPKISTSKSIENK